MTWRLLIYCILPTICICGTTSNHTERASDSGQYGRSNQVPLRPLSSYPLMIRRWFVTAQEARSAFCCCGECSRMSVGRRTYPAAGVRMVASERDSCYRNVRTVHRNGHEEMNDVHRCFGPIYSAESPRILRVLNLHPTNQCQPASLNCPRGRQIERGILTGEVMFSHLGRFDFLGFQPYLFPGLRSFS